MSALRKMEVRTLTPSEPVAVSAIGVSKLTVEALATKAAELAPAGTTTFPGTVSAGLSTDMATLNPPERAGVFKPTVQVPELSPFRFAGEQESEDTCGGGSTVTLVLCATPANVPVIETD
jgi:hypothetical protein